MHLFFKNKEEYLMGYKKTVKTENVLNSAVKFENSCKGFDYSFPFKVYCEITNLCPFKCTICPTGRGLVKRHGSMSEEIYKKVVNEVASWKLRPALGLYGMGEPLKHPRVCDYVHYAKLKGLKVFFATNASLLDEEKQIKLAESGLDELKISFEAENPAIYEKIRIGSNYKNTLHNIQSFLKVIAKRKIKMTVDILVIKYDENEPLDVKEKFKNLFLPLYDVNFYSYYVTNMNWKGAVQNDLLKNKGYTKEPMKSICNSYMGIIVSWDGKFRHCTNDFNDEFSANDISQMSLKEFWFSESRVKIMEKMKKGDWGNVLLCKGCSAPYTLLSRRRLYETKGKKIILDKALHGHQFGGGVRVA